MGHSLELPALALDATLEGDLLRLSYRLTNRLSEPIFVFDRPRLVPGAPQANICYGGGKLVLFLHGIVPRPPSPPYRPYESALVYPGAARVQSGAELVHEMSIPLPLEESTSYPSPPEIPQPHSEPVQQVRFVVEFVRKSNVQVARERKEHKGVYYVTGVIERVIAEVYLFRSVLLTIKLPSDLRFF